MHFCTELFHHIVSVEFLKRGHLSRLHQFSSVGYGYSCRCGNADAAVVLSQVGRTHNGQQWRKSEAEWKYIIGWCHSVAAADGSVLQLYIPVHSFDLCALEEARRSGRS